MARKIVAQLKAMGEHQLAKDVTRMLAKGEEELDEEYVFDPRRFKKHPRRKRLRMM